MRTLFVSVLVIGLSLLNPAGSNAAPIIEQVICPDSGIVNEAVLFSVVAVDPDDDALTITWDCGDGGTAQGNPVSHI